MTATSDPLARWEVPGKGRGASRPGRLDGRVDRLVGAHNANVANIGMSIARLEREVLDPVPLHVNMKFHDDQITALQQRVDLLTRALAKAGIVDANLFEDRPMADSCPYACDPGTGCPSCERQPELYCWRCEQAREAAP
jgi:hypothetical protein